MMLANGCLQNWTPCIEDNEDACNRSYAIVNSKNEVIGFFSYYIDWYSSTVNNFGLMSFGKRNNPIVGRDIFNEIKKLIDDYHIHRIAWRMVGGNPVEKHYDKMCEKLNGRKIVLKDTFKDYQGNYHDTIIYEVIANK